MVEPLSKPQPYLFSNPLKILGQIYHNFEVLNNYTFEKFLVRVFLQTGEMSEIYSENYESFLAWYLYLKRLTDLDADEKNIVVNLRVESFEKFNPSGKIGFNPNVKHCSLGFDKIHYLHKPLTLSVLLSSTEMYYHFFHLRRMGFQKFTQVGICYWYFEVPDAESDPVILLHGITIGLNAYSAMINAFYKKRSIIIIVYDCIMFNSMVFDVPGPKQVSSAVLAMLYSHRISQVSLIGHSWGTILAGWLIKIIPQRISHFTMIDPIATFVAYPEIVFEICYKPPKTFSDYFLYYFLRNDLTLASNLGRNCALYNMALGYDEIPHNIGVVVVIGENDALLDSNAVVEITDMHIASLPSQAKPFVKLFFPGGYHAETITNENALRILISTMLSNESNCKND